MAKFILILLTFLTTSLLTLGQQGGMTFLKAKESGLTISHLDSIYKSAVHIDTSKAVFKSEKEQELMGKAYIKLLQDFGKFLKENKFIWDKPTRCFNRIYFDTDGTIDYFIFNFLGKEADDKPSEIQQAEFERLLNEFIKDYKIDITAKIKFAQCSPTTYMPPKQD